MVKEQYISISHFVNPHLFWYHKVDGQNPGFVEQQRIEETLQDLFTPKQSASLRPHRPQLGEIIAVAFVPWGKYVRARVDLILKDNREDEYTVWAMDYGFPFRTRVSSIRKLPDSYKHPNDHICMGGIGNVIPVENSTVLNTGGRVCCKKTWTTRIVELVEKIMNDAASVSFIEQFSDINASHVHHFGEVKIIDHCGNEFFISDYLIEEKYAVRCIDDFLDILKKLDTANIDYLLPENASAKIVENKLNSFNINFAFRGKADKRSALSVASGDSFTKQKVLDWCERNENFDKKPDQARDSVPTSRFDASDISFDDSVSVLYCRGSKKNDADEETVMGAAGAIHKSRKAKYKDRRMPPKPGLDVFEISPRTESDSRKERKDEASGSGASSGSFLSKRTQALMELRKKHQQKAEVTQADHSVPIEEVAKITISEKSESDVDKFFALCKEINIQSQKARLDDVKNPVQDHDDSRSVSTISSRLQHLKRIKQKYVKQYEKEQLESRVRQPPTNKSVIQDDMQSVADSRVRRLIDIRRKYLKPNEDEGICMDENASIPTTSNRQGLHLYPHKEYVKATVPKRESSPPSSDSSILPDPILPRKKLDVEKMRNALPYKNFIMVPGGYDVTEVVSRKEPNRNNSTKSNKPPASDRQNRNRDTEKASRRTEDIEEQNFRLTRSPKERKKPDPVIAGQKHLLDESLTDTDCVPAISPEILSKSKVPEEKLIDLSSTNSELLNKSASSGSATSDSYINFVKAKSPIVNTVSLDLLNKEMQKIRKPNSKESSTGSTGSFAKIDSIGKIPTESNATHEASFSSVSSEVLGKKSVKRLLDHALKEESSSSSTSSVSAPNSLIKTNKSQPSLASSKHSNTSGVPAPNTLSSPKNRKQFKLSPNCLPDIPGEADLKTNLIHHLVLAHSQVKVTPIDRMSNALFSPEIRREMENMRLTKMYRIQSYAWSHLIRGNSFFAINGARTGKSWCYLPALCSLISLRAQLNNLQESYGPIAVIIAPSSKEVESIARQCRHLLGTTKSRITVVPSYAFRSTEDVKIELLNGCGILVITPPSLQRILIANQKELLINMKRIQYVIIDDVDRMLGIMDDFNDVLDKFIGPVLQQPENNGKIPFQMVVTSKRWSNEMIKLVRVSNQPLLCIGDFLEAAVYARAKLCIRLQSNTEKMAAVMKCLDSCSYVNERVVIVCSTADEVDDVEKALIGSGYSCLAYTDQMPSDYVQIVNEWKLKILCHQILITMDAVLPDISIQNAWTLIHYSLPTSWTRFNYRFSTLLQNYDNLLTKNFEKPIKVPKSLILLDEHNNLQLPRLIEFMKLHKQLKQVHPDIQKVAAKVTAEREEQRVSQGIIMCPIMLEFGTCDESSRCPHRHQLTKYDGPVDGIPSRGDIRLIILDVLSPTHYNARLLTHRDGPAWNPIKRSNEVARFLMQLSLYFMDEKTHTVHWPLRVNDLCVYKGEGIFHRCRLLEVPHVTYENIIKVVNVKVKLIDTGAILMCKSHNLLLIPEKFADFPAQAVDLRLSGVIPFDNERAWDSRSTRAVKNWIMTDIQENDCLQASINFALINTIWVNNLVVMEKLPAIHGFAIKINVKRSLIGKSFAKADQANHFVKQTSMELGVLKAVPDQQDISKEESESEEPSLNQSKDESNLMDFSKSTMYTGNESKLMDRDEESSSPNPTQQYSVLKPITKAAASNSAVTTTGAWEQLKLDDMQRVILNELRDPSKFYVRLEQSSEELRDLADIIRTQTKLPLDDPHPMQNCLALKDGQYYRAKIKRVIINSDGCVEARVFFCDLGHFANCPINELRASNQMLTEYMPFQAICCKLTGLQVEIVGDEIQNVLNLESGVYLSHAVKEHFDLDDYDEGFYINHYEIILYECFTDTSDILINKLLIDRGLASYDEDTKHFLELETKAVIEKPDDDDDDELCSSFDLTAFLERIKQQMDEEDAEAEQKRLKPLDASYDQLTDYAPSEPKIVEITEEDHATEKEVQSIDTLPALKALHKRPQTTWYQTMCMIVITISARDISDYHLEVKSNRLIFIASISGELQLLILDLLGYVNPELVSHEIRGLNVIVRLVKDMYMEWPRLLRDPTKFPWLNYNYNAIETREVMSLLNNEHTRRRGMSSLSESEESGTDSEPFQTFTPIVNGDDIHDPVGDLF